MPLKLPLTMTSSSPLERPHLSAVGHRVRAEAGCQLRGGRGVGDGQPDGPVTEVGHEVQPTTERLDIAGDHLEGGDLAVLDLGYPGDAYAHGGGDLLLAQAQLLAGLGELVPAGLGEQLARTSLNFSRGDPRSVQFPPGSSSAERVGSNAKSTLISDRPAEPGRSYFR